MGTGRLKPLQRPHGVLAKLSMEQDADARTVIYGRMRNLSLETPVSRILHESW
jgi:hypothetical protein